jgi:methionyl-tRNA synthetase
VSRFFITTAIDYTNAAPHIGHAYEKVLADVIARYHRLKGEEVFFLTGVDQHGQKVQQSADKQGIEAQRFVDEITSTFVALWKKLEVEYDEWAATTDPLHKNCVRAILQKLWNDKDASGTSKWLYKKTERGWYSVRQEQFLTDKERGPDGEFGPEWQPVEEREEENFYFRLKDHKQWLLDFIDRRSRDGRSFVVPDFRVAELRNAAEKIENDLCISRPASRLKWGIPLPETFGAGFVTYVWFDALVNYISFAGYEPNGDNTRFKNLWPALHVIGKDILIPAHGIYWPVMLKALGFSDEEMPTLLVHGWWNIAGAKMSKSLGNIVDPDALADKYGAEALRYYLMSDIATGRDADFSEERLVQRYNTDLANSLGNLLNRTLNMMAKYRERQIAHREKVGLDVLMNESDRVLFGFQNALEGHGRVSNQEGDFVSTAHQTAQGKVEKSQPFELKRAIDAISEFVVACNRAVDDEKPWSLAKDSSQAGRLDAVLYSLAESLRIIAILISPVLPRAAHGIFDQLNWKLDEQGKESRFRLADAQWGGLPDGHIVGRPVPLFPRIETAAE